ncbi:MAG: hypothetical protein AAGF24_13010 [Cyanobacteria bacterium P01_H01_bin.121]
MPSALPLFDHNGYVTIAQVLDDVSVGELIQDLPIIASSGTRILLSCHPFSDFAARLRESPLLSPVLSGLVAVEGIFFVKTEQRNWSVSTHRDTIVPIHGSGPWQSAGLKEGMQCVHAPLEFMRQCVTVRVSLHLVPEGDILVVPGSHNDTSTAEGCQSIPLVVPRGGAIVMRPSLLHSSTKLSTSKIRRVVHFLYAPRNVPENYVWYHAA